MAGNRTVVTETEREERRRERRRERDRRNAPARAAARRERYAARTPAEKAADRERRQQNRVNRRAAARAAWIAEHGDRFPLCECGCGQPVAFGDRTPNRFRYRHQPPAAHAHDVQYAGERIPVDRARTALDRLRIRHGWTISQMADLGGVPRGTLWAILRKPGYAARYGVDADLLRMMLRRLAGMRDPLTSVEVQRINSRYRSTDPDRFR